MAGVLILYLILKIVSGILKVDIRSTTYTIQEQATYSISALNEKALLANYWIEMKIPSDVIPSTNTFSCSCDTGQPTCTYDLSTQILKVDNCFSTATDISQFTLVLSNVYNPDYAVDLNITDFLIMSSSGLIESYASDVVITIVAKTMLAASVTPASDVVAAESEWTFMLRTNYEIPANGFVIIKFPSYYTGVTSSCTDTISKCYYCTTTDTLTCTAVQSITLTSTCTCDKGTITVGVQSAVANTDLTFKIKKISNPPSTRPVSDISIDTTNNAKQKMETISSLTVTMKTPATITVNEFKPLSPNTKVGDSATYQLRFESAAIIYPDSALKIEISIPAEIEIQGYLKSLSNNFGFASSIIFEVSYSPTKVTITNSLDSKVKAPYIYSLNIVTMKNPGSTKTTSPISIIVRNGSYSVAQSSSSYTFSVSPGTLTSPVITPNSLVVNTNTYYTFTFTITNRLLQGGAIKITAPSSVTVSSRTNGTFKTASVISATSVVNVASNVISITNVASSDIQSPAIITIDIDNILNPPTTANTNTFAITTYSDSNFLYIIDTVATPIVSGLVAGKLKSVSILPSSYITGENSTYRISIDIQNTILIGGSIVIIAPTQVLIKDIVCSNFVGFVNTPTCTLSSDTVTIANGFSSSSLTSGQISLDLKTVRNPQTRATSSSFKIYTKLSSAYIDESEDTDATKVTMTTAHSLESVVIDPSSKLVGKTSDYYTFTIDPYNPLYTSNSFIEIYNPSELSFPSSPTCESSSPIVLSITCILSDNAKYLKVSFSLTEITTSSFSFTVLNMSNPLSTTPSNPFTIITYLTSNSQDSQIDTGSGTVTVTTPDSLDINKVQALNFGVGKSTNYIITVTNSMNIPEDGYIYLKLPTVMQVPDGVSCSTKCTKFSSNVMYIYPKPGFVMTPGPIDFTIYSVTNGSVSETRNVEISTRNISGGLIEEGFSSITFTCEDPCLACQGTALTCTSCKSDSCCPYFWSNQCNSTCQIGKVDIDGSKVCVSCSNKCLTCLASIDNCTSCLEGGTYPFIMDSTCVSQCTAPKSIVYKRTCVSVCPLSATVQIGDECLDCAQYCTKCENTIDNCTECQLGKFNYNNSCVSECPSGITVRDESTSTCKSCTTNCKTCAGTDSTCTSCHDGFVMNNSRCEASCPSGYISINGICEKCSVECATCKNSISYCTSCNSNSYEYNGRCVSSCPTGITVLIESECIPCYSTCATCITAPDMCLSCNSNKSLYSNQCLDDCPNEMVTVNGVCQSCDSNCAVCENTPTYCTSCGEDLVLYNHNCVSQCPDSTTIAVNRVCTICITPCVSCSNSVTECITCINELTIYEKTCVENCPEGYYKYLGKCEKSSIEPGECAQGCAAELRDNEICDPQCNLAACDFDNQMCDSNNDTVEDTEYDEDIRIEDEPFVCSSASVISLGLSLGSKLVFNHPGVQSSLIGLWGVVETGSWFGLAGVVGSIDYTHGRSLLSDDDEILASFSLIVILLVCHYIMNWSFLVVYYCKVYKIDEKHREWVGNNKKSMMWIYGLCGCVSYKCMRLSYSKMFNLNSLNAQFSKAKYIAKPLLVYTVIGITFITLPLLTIQFYILVEFSTGNLAWIIALDSFIVTVGNMLLSIYDTVYLINWIRKDKVNMQLHGLGATNSPLHTGLDNHFKTFTYGKGATDVGYDTDRSQLTNLGKKEEPEEEHFTGIKVTGDQTVISNDSSPPTRRGDDQTVSDSHIAYINSKSRPRKQTKKGFTGRKLKPKTKRRWFGRSYTPSSHTPSKSEPSILISSSKTNKQLSTQKVELFEIEATKGKLDTEKGVGEVSFYGYEFTPNNHDVETDEEVLDQLQGFASESDTESHSSYAFSEKDRLIPNLLETIPEESLLDISNAKIDDYDLETIKVQHIPSGAQVIVKKSFVGSKVIDEHGNEIPEVSPLQETSYELLSVNPNDVHEATIRTLDSETELRVLRNFDNSIVMDVKMPQTSDWLVGRAVISEHDWDFAHAIIDTDDLESVIVLHKSSGYRAKVKKTFLGAAKIDPETGRTLISEGVIGEYDYSSLEVDQRDVHYGWVINNGNTVRAKRNFVGGRIVELLPPELRPPSSDLFSRQFSDSVEFYGIPRLANTRSSNGSRYVFTKKLLDSDEQEPEAPPSKQSQASNGFKMFPSKTSGGEKGSSRASSRASVRSIIGDKGLFKTSDSVKDLELIYLQRLQVPGQPKHKKIRPPVFNPFRNHLDESSRMNSEQISTANILNMRSGQDYDIELLRKKTKDL